MCCAATDCVTAIAFADRHAELDLVPLLQAHAVPGGVLRREVYDALKDEFLAGLKSAVPWDGVYLEMHGAMAVEGIEDAEADFIGAVRAVVGSDCLISASYDLHGNLSASIMEQLDIITAYRTAPHEDAAETRARALRLLLQLPARGSASGQSLHSHPAAALWRAHDDAGRAGQATVYGGIERLVDGKKVLDASLLVGFTWADQARSASVSGRLGTGRGGDLGGGASIGKRLLGCAS